MNEELKYIKKQILKSVLISLFGGVLLYTYCWGGGDDILIFSFISISVIAWTYMAISMMRKYDKLIETMLSEEDDAENKEEKT